MKTEYVAGTDLSAKLADISISYNDIGEGEIPVIFIHGFPFDKSMWSSQLGVVGDEGRAISYDLRGFGKSEPGLEKFSMDKFADDLIEFMDVMNIREAVVCGLSMGGYILLNAVNRFPDRFKAIILSDSQCIADTPQAKEGRMNTIKEISENGLKGFTEKFLPKLFTGKTIERNDDMVDQIRQIILATDPRAVMNTLTALAERNETCSILGAINKPVLIICGDEDVITTPEQARFLQSNIPGSELHIIQGAGHLSNLEQQETFNRHLMEFVRNLK